MRAFNLVVSDRAAAASRALASKKEENRKGVSDTSTRGG
jgi:hypothetical protein